MNRLWNSEIICLTQIFQLCVSKDTIFQILKILKLPFQVSVSPEILSNANVVQSIENSYVKFFSEFSRAKSVFVHFIRYFAETRSHVKVDRINFATLYFPFTTFYHFMAVMWYHVRGKWAKKYIYILRPAPKPRKFIACIYVCI